ncbi:MAG: hypothetical protein ACLSTO_07345 [Bilophila wadsworthia]
MEVIKRPRVRALVRKPSAAWSTSSPRKAGQTDSGRGVRDYNGASNGFARIPVGFRRYEQFKYRVSGSYSDQGTCTPDG